MGLRWHIQLDDLGWLTGCTGHEQRIAELRRRMAGSSITMLTQSRQIETLHEENTELKVCVAALIGLLVEKGVLTPQEVSQMLEMLRKPTKATDLDSMDIEVDEPREADSSAELADLAKAADEIQADER